MKLNKIAAASLIAMMACGAVAKADTPVPTMTNYSNFYITYMSPGDVKSVVNYSEAYTENGTVEPVNRFFMWTIDQDAPIASDSSLIGAINDANNNAVVVTYYPNYAVYNNARAVPGGVSYGVAGNSDLTSKLAQTDEVIYAFAETQVSTTLGANNDYYSDPTAYPGAYGSIYMYDPWSDLTANEPFCGPWSATNPAPAGTPVVQNTAGTEYNLICAFAFDNRTGQPVYDNSANYNNFGNFEAFAALPQSVNGKTGAPIKTLLSIGGYGHNATYEAIFDPAAYGVNNVTEAQAMTNFVNSVASVLTHFNIAGIDLDYENVQMTHEQSQQYLTLLTQLNAALAPLHKAITIAVISNPDYINGTESNNTVGFAPGVLQSIANLSQVEAIDLMTYDFSGTFSYGGPSNPGTTGFLSDVYLPNDTDTPQGYNFDVALMLQTLVDTGVPVGKIGIGVPAYGRALASIPGPSGNQDENYLFSPLSSDVIIPAGDQDNADCLQSITDASESNACQGMFSYNYIMKNIVGASGAVATDHSDDTDNQLNGTTLFAPTWSVPGSASYTLTVINNNVSTGSLAIGSWNTAGYNLQANTSYPPTPFPSYVPSTSSIIGQTNLPVTFTYWKGPISCGTANFTSNLTVTISSDAVPTCSVSNNP